MRIAIFLVGGLLAAMPVWAQPNLILLNSSAGEYIGQGQFHYSTNPADFSIGYWPPAIFISAFGYNTILSGWPNGILNVGVYSNGVSISGNGRGCNTVCGSVQVFEMHT